MQATKRAEETIVMTDDGETDEADERAFEVPRLGRAADGCTLHAGVVIAANRRDGLRTLTLRRPGSTGTTHLCVSAAERSDVGESPTSGRDRTARSDREA